MDRLIEFEVTEKEFLKIKRDAKKYGFDSIESYMQEKHSCLRRFELAEKIQRLVKKENLTKKEFDFFQKISADYFEENAHAKLFFNEETEFIMNVLETLLKYLKKY